jgi:prophage regulatory protein
MTACGRSAGALGGRTLALERRNHEGEGMKPFGPDRDVAPNDRLLRHREAAAKVALGATYLYELVGEGKFPQPIHIGSASRYSELEINEWIAARRRERDAASTTEVTEPQSKRR